MDLRAPTDDAELVRAAQAGDGHAFGVLFDRWSTRVVDVAYRIVRDREVAAEVAQDAFLAAWTGLGRLERAESFGGWVLRIGRNRALNRLERERRSIPVDEETTDVLDRPSDPSDDAGDSAARAEDAELVWAAAAALGPRDASVLDLHLRHGLSPGEIAEELGVTANAAHQVLHRLRARLGDAVRACVLWRAGHPACPSLTSAVAGAGITAFGSDAVRVITAHAASCDACTGRQEARLAPEALFAAVPLLVVTPDVLASVRAGLADAGVPVGDAPAAPGAETEVADRAVEGPTPGEPGAGRTKRAAWVGAAGALVLVVVAILLLGDDGAEPEEVAVEGTTTASTTTSGEASTSSRPSGSSTTSTSTSAPGGVSSLPAPTPPAPSASTTTGPAADIGATSEPGLAPNPPSSAAPTTTAPPRPTTTTTTTAPPPPGPVISRFRVVRSPEAGTGCLDPSHRVAFVWSTTGADGVTIAGRGAPTGTLAPSGNATGCLVGAGSYTLTATGPGGSATQAVAVPR